MNRQIDYSQYPNPDQVGCIKRYIEHGCDPGSFLSRILANDFMGACGQADVRNRRNLFYIAMWLATYAPRQCYGSEVEFREWMAKGGTGQEQPTPGLATLPEDTVSPEEQATKDAIRELVRDSLDKAR